MLDFIWFSFDVILFYMILYGLHTIVYSLHVIFKMDCNMMSNVDFDMIFNGAIYMILHVAVIILRMSQT